MGAGAAFVVGLTTSGADDTEREREIRFISSKHLYLSTKSTHPYINIKSSTFSGHHGSQFGQQLVFLFLHLGFLLLQFLDGFG